MQCKALVRCLVPGKSSINICYYLYCSIPGVIGVLEEGTPNCIVPNPELNHALERLMGKQCAEEGQGLCLQESTFAGPRWTSPPRSPSSRMSELQSRGRRQWLRSTYQGVDPREGLSSPASWAAGNLEVQQRQ